MAKQTFTTGQVLTAAQMTSLQQTAMLGGAASAKTASYTLVATDAGTAISMSSASATTITVNTALFAAGDTVQITNLGAGVCTITAGTATVNSSASLALAQYESGTLDFTSTSAAIFIKGAGAAGGGALTLSTIASGSFTAAATLTLSSLSDYDTLILQLNNVTYGTAASEIQVRPNNTSSSDYYQYAGNFQNQTSSNYLNTDRIKLQNTINASNTQATNLILVLTNCKQAGFTNFYFETRCNSDGITGPVFATGAGMFQSAAAISSLVVLNGGGYTFDTSSTYKLIGG